MKKMILAYLLVLIAGCTEINLVQSEDFPEITPDYIGVTIPKNMSDIRFKMTDGRTFKVSEILRDSILWVQVSAWDKKTGEGTSYAPFPVYVSKDTIDPFISYTLIEPWDTGHTEAVRYLRDLESFRVKRIRQGEPVDNGRAYSGTDLSSNGKWNLYSSTSMDGTYSRLFISHLNEDSTYTKPFLLPQPLYILDELCLKSYCDPSFEHGAVRMGKPLFNNLFK